MYRPFLIPLSLCLSLGAGTAFADCTRASPPAIPNGKTSTIEDMQAAQQEVKAFIASSNAYLECLNRAGTAAGKSESSGARSSRLASYNAAVDEQTAVAGRFNAALRAFKAQNNS